ncbi:APC family permease [Patulibacter defluvii]|uniref:APC family permease n=1 Tax=Patulibacter defluvii TaxID=3095358 RepID=UPI002A753504|nr:APC family permease [Patulibacter sp. DM4]
MSTSTPASTADVPAGPETDAERQLLRDFDVKSAFSLAFAFLSPIAALYGIFAIGLSTVGPQFWWGFPITLAGQMLVALTFGQLASRWPYEGSVYQWARHLIGARYGWATGWWYIWVLCIATAAVSYSGGLFLAQLVGIDEPSTGTVVPFALLILAAVAWGNTHGRHVLKMVVVLCIGAEIIGSIGVGAWLLLFHREHGLDVLFEGTGAPSVGTGLMSAPFVMVVAFAGWSFLGFESAGAIAEEVRDPRRAVPKAMALSLLFVALVVMFASLSIILATPDMGAVIAGEVGDPVVATLEAQLGGTVTRVILAMFVIGFFASALSIQAAASRLVWALARDRQLPASSRLSKLSGSDRLPTNAVLLCAAISAALYAFSGTDLYSILVTATSGGFYVAFALPVIGLAIARARGRWRPGPFLAGRLGLVISLLALVWIVLETINIVWPRDAGLPWYETWAFFLVAGVVVGLGLIVRLVVLRGGPPPVPVAERDVDG